jgi:hypothetical protein
MTNTSIRWGRVSLGGVLAELILIVAVIPIYAMGGNETAITAVGVGGSFLVFLPVAWWLARPLPRPILHGMMMGAAAAAIYMTMSVVGRLFVPDTPPVPLIYYVGHALKLAGGAVGGWLAGRAARTPATTAASS